MCTHGSPEEALSALAGSDLCAHHPQAFYIPWGSPFPQLLQLESLIIKSWIQLAPLQHLGMSLACTDAVPSSCCHRLARLSPLARLGLELFKSQLQAQAALMADAQQMLAK